MEIELEHLYAIVITAIGITLSMLTAYSVFILLIPGYVNFVNNNPGALIVNYPMFMSMFCFAVFSSIVISYSIWYIREENND